MTSQDPTSTEQDRDATAPAGATDESTSGSDHVMDMLGEHVPLSLLMDLTSPQGPDSETISADEGLPDDSWWDEDGQGDGGSDAAAEERTTPEG